MNPACWCGVKNPKYSDECLERGCGGSGVLQCFCGGDQCVCHYHGETDCVGCEDCEGSDDFDITHEYDGLEGE